MNCDCAKCGADRGRPKNGTIADYCADCRWLLRLGGATRPFDVARLGLPAADDYKLRQLAETIPYGKRAEQWYEVY